MAAKGKDEIVDTELSIVDISVHFWLLGAKKIGTLTHKTLHQLYQIHEENFEFSLYLRDFSRTVSTVQQTLLSHYLALLGMTVLSGNLLL